MLENLKEEFYNPSEQFSMIPFWFLNGGLNKEKILNQMIDFKDKGIDGVVIHPRIGLANDIEYLGERYMNFIKFIVEKAKQMNMKVVLYDEGMYPSGSANGKVVKANPEYAARGLRMVEYECKVKEEFEISEIINENEKIVLAVAAKKNSKDALDLNSIVKLKDVNGKVYFKSEGVEDWSVIFLIATYSKGTIRGIHFGEDDGEENAPPAGDLLNNDAMKKFIEITHEAYYSVLKEHFGKTIIAMFTDEPNVLGRCVDMDKIKPWTVGFLDFYKRLGNEEFDLLSLWFDIGSNSELKRRSFKKAVNKKLEGSYYKQISDWCEAHNIMLTGHPEASDDIGVLKYFQIPGQDVVWRWVGPEDNKGIEGQNSTMAKCSSDAARHYGRRKNANECFGCCGPDGHQWEFSVDDMKWFMDWLFVRGVNTLYPHAFLYSIDGEKRLNERPPDVGPNNSWWKYYKYISSYAKRMSWVLTDSINITEIAVLCEEDHLPWHIVKPLYQNQIEFNYIESCILLNKCEFQNEFIKIEKQKYKALIIEDLKLLDSRLNENLKKFLENGGLIILYNPRNQEHELKNVIEIDRYEDIIKALGGKLKRDISLSEKNTDLRVSHVIKNGVDFYVLVNEGEDQINSQISMNKEGYFEIWDSWKGTITELKLSKTDKEYSNFYLELKRRESVIICVNKDKNPVLACNSNSKVPVKVIEIKSDWTLCNELSKEKMVINDLKSWNEFEEMKYLSGEIKYETYINVEKEPNIERVELELGNVFEMAELYIDDKLVGIKMWYPYIFDITEFRSSKKLKLTIKVTNSIARSISKSEGKSGIVGPIKLNYFMI